MAAKVRVAYALLIIGVSHAIVDATSVAIVFVNFPGMQSELSYFASLVIVYSVLAFSLQAPIGLIVDRFQLSSAALLTGLVLTAISALVYQIPPIAIGLAGIGNACFHVGGGVVSLNLKPKTASLPGIFVAPGSLGLLAGILIGKSGNFVVWHFVTVLVVAILATLFMKFPHIKLPAKSNGSFACFGLITLLLLVSVAVRSLIGLAVDFPWKSNVALLICLTLAVFSGKFLGGLLADRFGWIKVSVIGLLVSAPLVSLGTDYPLISIIGIFLFNFSMPVTLTALADMLPGRAGFAFGLASLALVTGAFPTFIGLDAVFNNIWIVFIVVLVSAMTLHIGLSLYFKTTERMPVLRTDE